MTSRVASGPIARGPLSRREGRFPRESGCCPIRNGRNGNADVSGSQSRAFHGRLYGVTGEIDVKYQQTAGHEDGNVYVGSAGWANPPEYRGLSGAKTHLEFYAETFNCVEINSSFHRSHRTETYAKWRESTPQSFAFSVKVPRSITHESALRDCRIDVERFVQETTGLGTKLKVVLVQLPPSLTFDARVASRFFSWLSRDCTAGVACECRHPSWFAPKAGALLSRLGVARVAADPAQAPGGDDPGGADRLAYYRLHGSPRVYYSGYSDIFIRNLASRLSSARAYSENVWCIFDNTAQHRAWPDALQLRRELATRSPSARPLKATSQSTANRTEGLRIR